MKAYYGSRISRNMTETPEGYLICHNVPISRTGDQKYLAQELGLNDRYGEVITVTRKEEEVFSEASLASFEGKVVTDGHPANWVDPSNFSSYLKGVVQNVRRGYEEDADKVIADLLIYDSVLISEIQAGKREISCGYDCKYPEIDAGNFEQALIRGNHVAVVDKARAGSKIKIKDEKPKGEKTMAKKFTRGGALAWLWGHTKDADPEELQAAADALEEENKPTPEESKDEDPMKKVLDAIESLGARLEKLETSNSSSEEQEEKTSLDELESELEKKEEVKDENPEEESVTIAADEMEEAKVKANDQASILEFVRKMKPLIADIPDPEKRKKMSDALSEELRKTLPEKERQGKKEYGKMLDRDFNKNNDDGSAFKAKCDERNPHKNKGGK